jgi:mono/diheme cytochrome c family protein
MRAVTRACRVALIALAIGVAAGGFAAAAAVRRGLSARDEPSAAEAFAARTLRGWATPRLLKSVANPVASSPELLGRARAHFADHCATCHGNDGSGRTPIGQRLYPRAPDMRSGETQRLSDGEIFSIIRNGVRLTGMPAWGDGTPKEDAITWELVHFVRHLPNATPEELFEMRSLNPRSPAEIEKEREADRFLAGAEPASDVHPRRRTE